MTSKQFVLVSIFIFTALSRAQTEDLNVRDPRLNEGKLFTLQFTPADRRIVVSAAGKPAAILGPDRVVIFGREVSRSGKSVKLRIESSSDSFKILDQLNPSSPIEIDIEDRATRKKETIVIQQQRP